MSDGLKASLKRLERLFQVRQTYVSVAEAAVKTAEAEVRQLEAAAAEVGKNIQAARAGIAYLTTATGHDLQTSERYIFGLQIQRKTILQAKDKATVTLELRRGEWREALREQKVIEKLQERRLHQWEREDNVALQKTADESSIGRHVRTRLKP